MIKNDSQLTRTRARLRAVQKEIAELRAESTGRELDILVGALRDDAEKLTDEIGEYMQLRHLSLQEAVSGPLSQPTLLDDIGELLAKTRIAAHMTQEQLAARLGWEQSNVSRFESENYHSQTIGKVVEYASELGYWIHVAPSLVEEPMEVSFRREGAPTESFQAWVTQWTQLSPVLAYHAAPRAAGLSLLAEPDVLLEVEWDVPPQALLTGEEVTVEGTIPVEYESTGQMVDRVATTSVPTLHLSRPDRPADPAAVDVIWQRAPRRAP